MNHLANENNQVVLELMRPVLEDTTAVDPDRHEPAVFLDVETTGTDPDRHEVIQIAMLPVWIDPETREIVGCRAPMSRYQQPSEPLSKEIREITGLNDDLLAGKEIDWVRVAAFLTRCKWVIAHNARFDWQFVNASLRRAGLTMPDTVWCCSMDHAEWPGLTGRAASLQLLGFWHGFWFQGHNAIQDVEALYTVFLGQSKILAQAFERASRPDFRVFAAGSQYNENALLKERSYKWDAEARCWWKALPDRVEAEVEAVWLTDNLSQVEPQVIEIDAAHRFC